MIDFILITIGLLVAGVLLLGPLFIKDSDSGDVW